MKLNWWKSFNVNRRGAWVYRGPNFTKGIKMKRINIEVTEEELVTLDQVRAQAIQDAGFKVSRQRFAKALMMVGLKKRLEVSRVKE